MPGARRLRLPLCDSPMKPRSQTALKNAFRASITIKGIDGALEAVGGLLLWLVHPSAMSAIVRLLFLHEIPYDPHDFIRMHALHASETILGSHRLFASLYLLSHGVTKVVLVIALWMNKLWAYPLTMVVFGAFSVYQMYRYINTHSIAMLILTIFDVLLIYLTWLEWREQEALRANPVRT
jgi:uncharacterized membrane protein